MAFMYESCRQKQSDVKAFFHGTTEERYQQIIRLGRELPPLSPDKRTPENLVKGCQSATYLYSRLEDGKVYFEGTSDALISAGLAALLIKVYSGETPETILKCPPDFLEELGISASLTPNRASGLYSMHLRMKQDALKYYSITS